MSRATRAIGEYAAIGDGRSAALISGDGSLDWLCWPRFDSPSLFAALLDPARGGAFSIGPSGPAATERRYLDETNVLCTRFQTPDGVTVLTDFMPVCSEEEKRRSLHPERELIRRVQCEAGEADIRVRFNPRPDYGRDTLPFQDAGPLGLRLGSGSRLLLLRSDARLSPAADGFAARLRMKAGDTVDFSLTDAEEGPAVLPPLGALVSEKLASTIEWWKRWAARARYNGPHRAAVIRSALALKLLSYAPSGAIVAAATTSLPERPGGTMNWDYRYCWLRDAAFTARALFGLGYEEEADAFVSWLLHATRLTRPELKILYDPFGGQCPPEAELSHLRGYAESRPVRIGNAARDQYQLDVYGEVIEAVARFDRPEAPLDRETQAMLRQFGAYVCENWHRPDNGIWESRGPRRHFTHSRLLCWVALDRLIDMSRRHRLRALPVEMFTTHRDSIRREIAARGWNRVLGYYTQTLDGTTCDATALLLALHGFEEPSSDRMRRTWLQVHAKLAAGPGLLYRSEQSPTDHEGAFAICSFWVSDFLARGGGSLEEANRAFEETARYANRLGLFAEEIDPETGAALGNFPQAFTHVGLINSALSLARREERDGG